MLSITGCLTESALSTHVFVSHSTMSNTSVSSVSGSRVRAITVSLPALASVLCNPTQHTDHIDMATVKRAQEIASMSMHSLTQDSADLISSVIQSTGCDSCTTVLGRIGVSFGDLVSVFPPPFLCLHT
jgi:hypothetical protein